MEILLKIFFVAVLFVGVWGTFVFLTIFLTSCIEAWRKPKILKVLRENHGMVIWNKDRTGFIYSIETQEVDKEVFRTFFQMSEEHLEEYLRDSFGVTGV